MSVDRRALAGALAALLLLAACGGSATQAPVATQTPGASQAPGASQEATETQSPEASQEATETQSPGQNPGPGTAGDLEAMLPSVINGVTFQKASFNGGIIPGGIPIGQGDEDLGKFLADNGKSLSDVGIAMATATDAKALGSVVMAIQIKGVPSDKLLAWATKGSGDMPKTNVGGKEVYGAAEAGFGAFIYVKDDVIFYVLSMGGDGSMAENALKQLP